MTYVVGVDPGKTTGIAMWCNHDMYVDRQGFMGAEEFDTYGAENRIEDLAGALTGVVFAVERFTISAGTLRKVKDAHWAIEMIGIVKRYCRKFGHDIMLQGTDPAKRMSPDTLLKTVGWHYPGLGHANDATRQVVLALADRWRIPPPWVR